MSNYQSWGKYPLSKPSRVHSLTWRTDDHIPINGDQTFLAFGQGRSYGDCCLNNDNTLLATKNLNHFIHFEEQTGILCCETGVLLKDILNFSIPRGWFLSVVPGTQYVTLGGAIANDIHGKNHHQDGTFGCHVINFELIKSDGRRRLCSKQENADLFYTTIGGIGLTGLITYATIQLKRIQSSLINVESIKFADVNKFIQLSQESKDYLYTAAWVDGLARGNDLGRGIFMRGNHAEISSTLKLKNRHVLSIPFDFPMGVLNKFTMQAFNKVYYNRQRSKSRKETVGYESFLFPLDHIGDWNRLYGKRGFLQYQYVVPEGETVTQIFRIIEEAGMGSFLTVMKMFTGIKSPGLMSFPKKGITVTLDFPNYGKSLYDLLHKLDKIVEEKGGRVYLAKDACMSAESFKVFYPQWKIFKENVDPRFSSTLWRRVTQS